MKPASPAAAVAVSLSIAFAAPACALPGARTLPKSGLPLKTAARPLSARALTARPLTARPAIAPRPAIDPQPAFAQGPLPQTLEPAAAAIESRPIASERAEDARYSALRSLASDVREIQQAPLSEDARNWDRYFDLAPAGLPSIDADPTSVPAGASLSRSAAPAPASSLAPSAFEAAPKASRTTLRSPAIVAAAAAALSGLPQWAHDGWKDWGPTIEATAVAGLTAFIDRNVRHLTDRLTANASPRVKLWVRWGARSAVWAAGGAVALNRLGIPWSDLKTALFTGAGIGGLALTFGFKDLIADYVAGAQTLLTRPFDVGDELLLDLKGGGKEKFLIEDMDMREMTLRSVSAPNEKTRINYASLSDKAVVVLRAYQKRYIWNNLWGERHLGFATVDRNPLEPWIKHYLPLAGLLGLMVGTAWIAQPVIFSAATGLITLAAERRFRAVVQYWQDVGILSRNAASVLRRIGTITLYAVNATRVLDVFGFTWPKVLLGNGLTPGRTVVAGIVGGATIFGSGDAIRNFFRGVYLIGAQPFKLGDRVQIGGVRGRVEDITLRSVVIGLDDGSGHALVPTQLAVTWTKID